MSSDTAAFFAKKKKKKKAFKFNANLVDASTVTHTEHVDAPALSTDQEAAVTSVSNAVAATDMISDDDPLAAAQHNQASADSEQWDDEALASTLTSRSKGVAVTSAEVLDMKSLESGRPAKDNIKEKLRVEETKAQLAAAREGMEREAAKLKEEQEKKEKEKQEKAATTSSRFGAAAAAMGSSGGKWLPPHLRAGGAASAAPVGWGATSKKLDVQDQELFPDLASADKIIEKKEKEHQPVFKVPKKTPVGGGATWASKTATKPAAAPVPASPTEPAKKTEPAQEEPSDGAKKEEPKPSPPTTASATKTPATKIAPKKKKKKDLSTFKRKS